MGSTSTKGAAVVVLAAGLGTRFGGLKQLAPVGPSGESLLAYSLRDAAFAGFERVVLVVRREIHDEVVAHVEHFCGSEDLVAVDQDAFGPSRASPWGTAHAIVACRAAITSPFAVVNADDLYGADALVALADHLRGPAAGPGRASLVTYRVAETLSSGGGVSRATVQLAPGGSLTRIEEHTGVRRDGSRIVSDTEELSADALVSMNLWGFDPSVIDDLAPLVEAFTRAHQRDTAELRLPDAVEMLVESEKLRVTVLPTLSQWIGITFPEDVEPARVAVREMLDGSVSIRTEGGQT